MLVHVPGQPDFKVRTNKPTLTSERSLHHHHHHLVAAAWAGCGRGAKSVVVLPLQLHCSPPRFLSLQYRVLVLGIELPCLSSRYFRYIERIGHKVRRQRHELENMKEWSIRFCIYQKRKRVIIPASEV
jgi:hypothetical protein